VRASQACRDRLGRPKPDVVEPFGWTDDVKVIIEGLGVATGSALAVHREGLPVSDAMP